MATTVPTNLENPGVQPKSLRTDNFGSVQYLKIRNAGSEAYDTRAYSGAPNITFQPSDFIRLIVFISTATFTQATLPATATLAAYLQRVFSVENQTGTLGGNPTPQDGKVYYFPFIIDNQRNLGTGLDLVTLVAGDGNTTFALGTNQVGRGLNRMLIRFSTAGSPAVATLTIVPDFRTGGTGGPSFASVPAYTPFPLQDADNLGVWDASNGNQWSSMTRAQLLSGGITATNVLLGPGANYAATGGGNVGIGNTTMAALTTGTFNTSVGNNTSGTLTTGARNTAIGASNMFNANAAAVTDCTVIGNTSTVTDAAQNGSILIGNGVAPTGAFATGLVIGSAYAPVLPAATTFFTNRVRATGAAAANMTWTAGTGEITIPVSNRHVKKDIKPLSDDVVDKFDKLNPVQYTPIAFRIGKNDELEYFDEPNLGNDKIAYGFMADEINKVLPEIVVHGRLRCYSEKQEKWIDIESDENYPLNYSDRSFVSVLAKVLLETRKQLKLSFEKIDQLEERLININA